MPDTLIMEENVKYKILVEKPGRRHYGYIWISTEENLNFVTEHLFISH